MLEYLYTTKYTGTYHRLVNHGSFDCGHPGDDTNCSCADEECYLRAYGIAISLYAMGDKYDVPGLMTCSCAYIQEMLSGVSKLRDWTHDFEVWTLAYTHSRKSDELRAVLLKLVCHGMSEEPAMADVSGFLEFLERSPELALPLLKITLQCHADHYLACPLNPFVQKESSSP